MSLKDWMKKVESTQLNEFATPKAPVTSSDPKPNQTAGQQTAQNTNSVSQGLNKVGIRQNTSQLAKSITAPAGTRTAAQDKAVADAATAMGIDQILGDPNSVSKFAPISNTVQQQRAAAAQQGQAPIAETEYDQVGTLHDQIQVESKPKSEISDGLRYIKDNYKHECKMYEDGWGLDESMYSALVDHYYHEGKIPRSLMIEGGQALREFIEGCYAKDTGMGGNQDAINNGMLDEEDVAEGPAFDKWANDRAASQLHKLNPSSSKENFTMNARRADPRIDSYATDPKPSRLGSAMGKVGSAMKTVGGKVMDKLHPNDEKLRSGPLGPLDEEMSPLERSLRQSTKEKEMFESKKTRSVQEATEKTKTGLKHKADAGGYGRVDDEEDTDEDGKKIKKVKKDEPKKGRGRPKKSDNASGEDKKFDFSAFGVKHGEDIKLKPWDKKKTTVKKIATKADREEVDEAVTKTKTGIKHTADAGGYGRRHDDDEDDNGKKVKASPTAPKGRGRPKKTANASGEDKNYDWSAFGATKGVKLPAWDKKKTTSHKIATKADREEVEEAKLKGRQKKIDINKNGKIDGGDFAMLRGQKKKDPQMESWDRQLKGLLTEGMSVSTSTGQAGGEDSVSITATAADAGKLLQILQNAGLSGGGAPAQSQVVNTNPAPAQASTTATSPATGSSGGSAANADLNGSGSAVTSMPMPRGMAFSVQPAETDIPTAPVEVNVSDSEEVFNQLGKDHGQSEKSDNGDDALSFLKKAIGHSTEYADGKSASTTDSTPAQEETEEVEENDEDGKKPDEDGDGVPDWADKKPGKDDSEESDTEEEPEEEPEEDDSEDEEEKVDEGKETCNECGGLMEDDHQCESQLNEWSNSPQGQSVDEQFKTDLEFMQNIISGGLNKKKEDQTVMPHTKVKVTESKVKNTASAYTLELKKLAGI